VLLHRSPDVSIAGCIDDGRHVAMQQWGAIISAPEKRQCRAEHIGAGSVIGRDTVATGVDQGAQQIRPHLGAAILIGPDLIEHRASIDLALWAGELDDLDSRTTSRLVGDLPGIIATHLIITRPKIPFGGGHGRHASPRGASMVPVTKAVLRDEDLTDRMLDSLRTLVEAESPSADPEACRACAEVAVDVINGWLATPATLLDHRGRAAVRWGATTPHVLLIGHLDTVWPVGTLDRLPWSVEGDRVRGPGVFDMKAGIIQGIAALAALGCPPQVGLLLTSDEEIGSGTSRDLIEASAAQAAAVFVLEPSVDGELKSSRKGTSWYEVEILGRAAHAGLEPEKGINALVEAAALVTAATTWGDPVLGTTVTPTTARAGVTDNTVPDRAVVGIDARAWSHEEQVRVDELIRGWQPVHPQAQLTVIAGGINRPAMVASERLLHLASEAATSLGLGDPGHRAVGGGSDGNFTAAIGAPTLDGLGAVGDGAHADHEWASVEGMRERAALLATLIELVLAEASIT
jgi:glutamate carboxypeptidase